MDKNTSQFCARGVTTVMLLSVLSACGGSGATMQPDKPPTPETKILAEMSDRNTALLAKYNDPLVYTDLTINPSNATYTGFVQGDLANRDDNLTDKVIGEMLLSMDFNTVNVSGSATNFLDELGAPMSGSLTFSDGKFNRSALDDVSLTLSADGTLTDTNNQQLLFETTFEGDFLGDSYDAIYGDLLGVVTHNSEIQNFDGKLIAEK